MAVADVVEQHAGPHDSVRCGVMDEAVQAGREEQSHPAVQFVKGWVQRLRVGLTVLGGVVPGLSLHRLAVSVHRRAVAVYAVIPVLVGVARLLAGHADWVEVVGPLGWRPVVDVAFRRGLAVAVPPPCPFRAPPAVVDPRGGMGGVQRVHEHRGQAPLLKAGLHLQHVDLDGLPVGVDEEVQYAAASVGCGHDLLPGRREAPGREGPVGTPPQQYCRGQGGEHRQGGGDGQAQAQTVEERLGDRAQRTGGVRAEDNETFTTPKPAGPSDLGAPVSNEARVRRGSDRDERDGTREVPAVSGPS